MPFSFFISEKSQLEEVLEPFFVDLKNTYGIIVKIVRCDNAGENRSSRKTCKSEGHGIKFEYTAPGTPQQNGRVERKFQTLYGRIRAMLAGSGFSRKIQLQLWTEAANTATLLDSYLITDASDMNSYQKFFGKGKRCPVTEPTKKFGEPCIVSDRTKIKSKLQERGKEANWIGYASDHATYRYHIFNPKTRKVILSRDVTFIGQKVKQAKLQTITMEKQDESDSDEEILTNFTKSNLISDDEDSVTSNNESINNEEDNDDFDLQNQDDNQQQEDSLPQNIDNPKVIRAMKNLQASYNPDAQKILDKQSEHTRDPNQSFHDSEIGRDESQQNAEHTELPNLITDIADIAMPANESEMNQEIIIEPKNFNEAWFHSDPTQKDKWREAILKEHRDMDSRQVWQKINDQISPKIDIWSKADRSLRLNIMVC